MKSLVVAGLMLLAAVHWPAAAVRAEMRLSQSFDSAALGRAMAYSIYLPPGADQGQRFPVVYLLHGTGDSERSYPKAGAVEATMDALIARGEIAPMIVVMPDGKRSWYVNSSDIGGAGDYETAIMRDLIAHVDKTYPTRAEQQARFITGHSMGGFGALRLAFKFPDRFGAVAAMSAALWDRVKPGYTLSEAETRIFGGSFGAPFRAERFLAQRPRAFLPALAECACAPPIYLTAGDDDYFGAYRSTPALFAELREANLEAELRITDGGHTWKLWRETALPNVLRWFSARLQDGPTAARSR
jgi:enterochelin esterase family protein